MAIATDKNIVKIAEIRQKTAAKLIEHEPVDVAFAEQKMLKLLRVDGLMRSMRTLASTDWKKADQDTFAAVDALISAYKGSGPLIYGEGKSEAAYDELAQRLKNKLTLQAVGLSKEVVETVKTSIPMTTKIADGWLESQADLEKMEKDRAAMGKVKHSATTQKAQKKNVEAEAVLAKILTRIRKKDRNAQIVQFVYGANEIAVKTMVKKSYATMLVNAKAFEALNSPEGIAQLNEILAQQKEKTAQKAAVQEDVAKTQAKQKELEQKISDQKLKIGRLEFILTDEIKSYVKKMSGKEMLGALAPVSEQDKALHQVLQSTANFRQLHQEAVAALKEDKKVWNYVSDATYYTLIKDVVRAGCNKNSLIYQAMPEPLKDMLAAREIELYGLKRPDEESIKDMNNLLDSKGYRVDLRVIKASDQAKAKPYKGLSGSKTAELILANAQTAEGEQKISPYKRRYMTLGLMYALGEGGQDDKELYNTYMAVYFDKAAKFGVDMLVEQKEYGWDSFKKLNASLAKEVYQEISQHEKNPETVKKGLLNGGWEGEGIHSVDHIYPRRLGACSAQPNELNNQPNLAIAIQWNAWDNDVHQQKHMFNLSQHDGALPYMIKENGAYVRRGEPEAAKEIYFETGQVKRNGKWEDIIPEDSLLVTPDKVLLAPKLPENVKNKAIARFEPLSILPSSGKMSRVVKEKTQLVYA